LLPLRGKESLKYQSVDEPVPYKLTESEYYVYEAGYDHGNHKDTKYRQHYVQASGKNAGNRGERTGTCRIFGCVLFNSLIEIVNDKRLEITNIHREFREYETHRVTENEIRFEYLLCQYDQLAPKGHSIVSETNEGTRHEKHDEYGKQRHSEVSAAQKLFTGKVGIKNDAVAKKAIDYEEPEMLSVLIIGIAPKLTEH
jgi:hypothetical protein